MNRSKGVPRFAVVLSTIVLLFSAMGWSADEDQDRSEIEKRIEASAKVLTEVMATPDKAIPNKVLSDAKCLAVIPNMVKIAVGFGGSHGKGIATCRTPNGWSAPAPITITGGSWGLQLGGQAVDLVMVIMNDQGFTDVALQPVLGILPKWRPGFGDCHCAGFASGGADLAGGNLG